MPSERMRSDDDRPRRPPRARRDDDDDYDDRPPRRRRDLDEETGDVTGGVIPYKNGMALASYYCGVFGLIPVLGLVLAPLAIIFGILGFRYALKHPKARGKAHAITGIVFAVILTPALWIGIFFLFKYVGK